MGHDQNLRQWAMSRWLTTNDKNTWVDIFEGDPPWQVYARWPQASGYYNYQWWGLNNPDGTYDFMARRILGQVIYVSPSRNLVVVRFGGEPDPDLIWPFVIRSLIQSIR
jgi:CubicO group peptidase (beta-lactamase class C family)